MMSVEDIMSTLGDVQYTGDTMSTPGDYHDECGGNHEYNGSVQYTRGISLVHRGLL